MRLKKYYSPFEDANDDYILQRQLQRTDIVRSDDQLVQISQRTDPRFARRGFYFFQLHITDVAFLDHLRELRLRRFPK